MRSIWKFITYGGFCPSCEGADGNKKESKIAMHPRQSERIHRCISNPTAFFNGEIAYASRKAFNVATTASGCSACSQWPAFLM